MGKLTGPFYFGLVNIMPKGEYFEGHGKEVARSVAKAHPGDKKLQKRIFYATANKTHGKPGQKVKTVTRGSTRVDTTED